MLPPFAASSAPRPPPTIFVTVGSTAFSPLIARVLSPTVLSLLPPNSKLLVQYGKSDLASILAGDEGILTYSSPAPTTAVAKAPFTSTSAGFTQIDAGSEFHPEAGLRKTQQGGYSWKGSTVKALDPGRTGRIQGWELLDGRREEDQGQGTQTGMRRRRRRRRPRRSTEDQATKAGSSSSTSSASSSGSSSSAEENRREDPPSRAAPPHGSAGATILTSPPTLNFKTAPPHDVCITLMAYVPSLTPHLKEADLVVAHAGAGTILETLRLPPSPSSPSPTLLLVPNESLMDNHQLELARAILAGGWARCASLHSHSHSHSQPHTRVDPSRASAGASGEGEGEFPSLEKELLHLLAPWRGQGKGEEGGPGSPGNDDSDGSSASTRWQPRPFPRAEPERFRRLVDEEMGYL